MLANALWLFGAAKARTSHAGLRPGDPRYSPQRLLTRAAHCCRQNWRTAQCSVRALFSSLKIRARGLATAMAAMDGGSTKRAIVEIISDVV